VSDSSQACSRRVGSAGLASGMSAGKTKILKAKKGVLVKIPQRSKFWRLLVKTQFHSLSQSAAMRALLLSLLFWLVSLIPTASAQGLRPSGSFGFQMNSWVGPDEPNPEALIGVFNFDGAGKVTVVYDH